jgi:hypothetical protein
VKESGQSTPVLNILPYTLKTAANIELSIKITEMSTLKAIIEYEISYELESTTGTLIYTA